MKALLGFALLVSTLSVHAQSYVLQMNGTLLTQDAEGRVYDLNQFVNPNNIVGRGKNWLLDRQQLVTTISNKGFVFKKTDMKGPKGIKAYGDSWFISDKGEMNVVTREGLLFTYTLDQFKKSEVLLAGGNWLTLREGSQVSFVTIDTVKGFTYTLTPQVLAGIGLNPMNIKEKGGNYFVDSAGVLFTVDRNGLVSNKKTMGLFAANKKLGSNYLVDAKGGVRVVLDNGWMLLPNLPANMGGLNKTGTTHAWDSKGQFFTFAETAPDAEVSSSNPAVFNGVLSKLVLQPVEQVDERTLLSR